MEENETAVALTGRVEQAGEMSLVVREQAEVQAAILAAKKFPRDETAAYTRSIKSFERASLAEAAQYRFPRGGKQISGPSVDCARELARCWGNIKFGHRVVSVDGKYIHIKGYATDLETNNSAEAEDKFERKIQRKKHINGESVTIWVDPDERDLRELVNRRGAILVRNCILQILPPDLVEQSVIKANQTLAKAAKGELEQNRDDAIRRLALAFDKYGVSLELLAESIGHDLSLITPDELSDLRKIWKSLSDGHTKPADHFNFGTEKVRKEDPLDKLPDVKEPEPAKVPA